jgi:hypothetical protein
VPATSAFTLAGEEQIEQSPAKAVIATDASQPFDPLPYIVALVAVAAALGVSMLVKPLFGIENVDLILLTAVVGVAVRYGLWPSLLACVAASLCYNFFFLPPVYTSLPSPIRPTSLRSCSLHGPDHSRRPTRRPGQTCWTVIAAHRERSARLNRSTPSAASSPAPARLDDVLWATAIKSHRC